MKKGMTLFIAITVTSSAMLIALGIFQIVFGQIRLSQSARESHKAFYSADVGKECALYYLNQKDRQPDGTSNGTGRSYWGPESYNMCFYRVPGDPDPSKSYCKDKATGNPNNKCRNISCGGLKDIEVRVREDANTCIPTEEQQFLFTIDNPAQDICADVDIRTQKLSDGTTDYYKTIITSDGWNNCDTSASNRVNRTLQYISCSDTGSAAFPCI